MNLCMNGCGNVFESNELLEILDGILGINNSRHDTREPIEVTALMMRIERMAKAKLRKKGNNNAKVNHTR